MNKSTHNLSLMINISYDRVYSCSSRFGFDVCLTHAHMLNNLVIKHILLKSIVFFFQITSKGSMEKRRPAFNAPHEHMKKRYIMNRKFQSKREFTFTIINECKTN